MTRVPVFCKAKGGLYWIGTIASDAVCTVEWVSRFTGIDPDNVKQIERQPKRWFITLVYP